MLEARHQVRDGASAMQMHEMCAIMPYRCLLVPGDILLVCVIWRAASMATELSLTLSSFNSLTVTHCQGHAQSLQLAFIAM